ncbi:carboxymuconolactone decarboxylase family protein [Humitalea sp. 24SJ18S-53]|uniref:carboxymuconolactone decarboxylase family protein n=1 Tax=Humitalea sp. 24SJ18S-53 TaxID=3422307 RepID=UPI003D67BB29
MSHRARIALPPEAALSDAQRLAVAEVTAGKRGRVPGPMIAWLASPELARRAQALGEYVRYETTLGPALSELAILLTARHWTSHYEWIAHKKEALKAGVPPDVIADIAAHRMPPLATPAQRAVYDISRSLLDTRGVPDELYARGVQDLGERGVVELVSVLGYYAFVSMTLNTFHIGAPDSVAEELL